MTQKELANLVKMDKSGHFMTVEFIKRSTGELRVMNCRTGVKKYVKGVGSTYNFAEKGLVCVYDIVKKSYRTIPLDGIIRVRINGKQYDCMEDWIP